MKYQPLVNQFLLPILREPPTPNAGYKAYLGRPLIGIKLPATSEDNQKQEESNHSQSHEEVKLSNN
jgi:hypothetical protein